MVTARKPDARSPSGSKVRSSLVLFDACLILFSLQVVSRSLFFKMAAATLPAELDCVHAFIVAVSASGGEDAGAAMDAQQAAFA